MKRVVYSQRSIYSLRKKFMWIWINPEAKENKEWLKTYSDKVLPTAYMCLFNGKKVYTVPDVCTLKVFAGKLKKLYRKNKSAWRKEEKKRKAEEKKKKEEEKKKKEEEEKEKQKDDSDSGQ